MAVSDQSDPFVEVVDGPTPNGGVGANIYYLNERGEPSRKSLASQAEFVEVDKSGEQVFRAYISINKRSTLTKER
jgi:hypothetical protein